MSGIKSLLLTSTVLVGWFACGTALAQDTAAAGPQESAAPADIVVTGSRIRSANIESVSPIAQVDAEEFLQRGTVRTEDLLNQLPQVFAAQGANNSNEATGTAQVDLRGLTPSRTLVLVNGRRLPYGSPKNIPSDVNQVPVALIEQVEVLTGGASAVYGSDAIAGVVNFKLIDDFSGLKLISNLSAFQHNNDRGELRGLLDENNARVPGGFLKPDGSVWNGFAQDHSLIVGANIDDRRGNVTAYASYRKVEPILQKDFDYSACALGTTGPNGNAFSCSGSPTNAPANLTNAANIPGLPTSFRVENGQFVPGTQLYNFAPFNYYQRPDERYALGAFAHYEITPALVPYVELNFMDNRSVAQIAPGTVAAGVFNTAGGISGVNCDNPFLSAQQADYLCTSRGLSTASNYDANGNYLGPVDFAEGVRVARRNVEGGPRQDDIRHSTFRMVGGLRGELGKGFSYDVFGSYSNVSLRSRFTGDTNRPRLARAFYAVRDQRAGSATRGQVVCAVNADASIDNDDPNCRPIDYFGAAASPESVAYTLEEKTITGDTSLLNFVGSVSGNLGVWGVQSPWADQGVGIAIGAEYRKNRVDYRPDELYQAAASPELPISGKTVAKEVFGEINVPVVSDVALFNMLALEGAYRYSDYDTGFTTDTYKLGVNWEPIPDIRLRGSYQRAVRAPNVIELFSSQSLFEVELVENADGSYDPCSGTTPVATFQQCANTGVTAGQYGNIIDNPAGQFFSLIGGNPDLQPETAKTYTLGAVLQPRFLPRLTVSIDYFDIQVDDLVGSVNPNLALTNCLNSGDPYFCGLIQRDNSGSLWQSEAGYFKRFNVNTGSLSTKGVDIAVLYRTDLADLGLPGLGKLDFNLQGTYLDSYKTVPLPDSPQSDIYECKGLYGGLCGRPRPEWRHRFLTQLSTPIGLDFAFTWRHVSSVKISQTSDQAALTGSFAELNRKLGARNYFDLAATYRALDNLSFRLGVNNIFDTDPPLTTTAAIEDGGNGNTYPQFYDATGRYLFFSAQVEF